MIGNPVHNPNVKELYLEEISRKQPVAPIQTTVKVEKESLLLETITASSSLQNIIRKEVMWKSKIYLNVKKYTEDILF